jgi:hypothetical protein
MRPALRADADPAGGRRIPWRWRLLCPLLGLCFGLAGFPWLRIEVGVLEISPMHVLLIVIFGALAFGGLKLVDPGWLLVALAQVLFMTANLAQAAGDEYSTEQGIRWIVRLATCVLLALGAAYFASRHPEETQLFLGSATTGILLIGAGLFYYSFFVLGDEFINVSFQEGRTAERNQAAFTFAVGALLAVGSFFERPSLWRGARAMGLIVLTGLGASRGAVGACGVGIVAFLLMNFRRQDLKYVLPAMVVLAWLAAFTPESITDRFTQMEEPTSREGLGDRDELYRIAFGQVLPEAPIFGHGTGTAAEYLRRYYRLGIRVDAHSDWNRLAIEGGLVALALGVAAYLLPLHRSYRALRRLTVRNDRLRLGTYFALLVAFAVRSMVETQFDYPHMWILFGLMFGFLSHSAGATAQAWSRRGATPSAVLPSEAP